MINMTVSDTVRHITSPDPNSCTFNEELKLEKRSTTSYP